MVVDRGFRNSIAMIEGLGLGAKMPTFLGKSEKQHTTEDANTSRLVTKIRWVVESANGRLKRWKFLANVVPNTHLSHIGDYVRIVASLINAYRPPLASDNANDHALAQKMLQRSQLKSNPLKERFVAPSGRKLPMKMKKVDANTSVEFPVLSEDYLRTITFGTYQLKQAKCYAGEHVDEDGSYDIFVSSDDTNILQAKIQSRHVTSKQYYMWIQYNLEDETDPIVSWYCQCKAGARLVGCCAHIASVM